MADASIYNALRQPIKSATEYAAEYGALGDQMARRKQNALLMRQQQQEFDDDQAVRKSLASLAPDAPLEARVGALRATGLPGGFKAADALEASKLKADRDREELAKTKAETGKIGAETQSKQADRLKLIHGEIKKGLGFVFANPTREGAESAISQMEQMFGVPMDSYRQQIANLQTPEQLKQWAAGHAIEADKQLTTFTTRNTGGTTDTIAQNPVLGTVRVANSVRNTQSPESVASVAATIRGQNMSDARAREANDLQRNAARTQIVVDPTMGVLAVDKGSGTFKPVRDASGSAIPGEASVASKKRADQLQYGITEARKLIPQATGSGLGAARDAAGNLIGMSSQANDAATQLETLSGWLTANVPRMEGPQSNADMILYQRMAADVGNRKLPQSARLKALDTLETLQGKYQNQGQAAPQAQTAKPANKPSVSNW